MLSGDEFHLLYLVNTMFTFNIVDHRNHIPAIVIFKKNFVEGAGNNASR